MIQLKTIGAHEARSHFGQLLKEVGKDSTFLVKRRGEPMAVIMSPEHYKDLFEIIEELNDPEMQKALAQSQKEFERGEVGTEEDMLKILRGESETQK